MPSARRCICFVEDDIARDVSLSSRIYGDACAQARPAVGAIQYGQYTPCNLCAIEYEVGCGRGMITTPGQYVRDKHFDDVERHVLEVNAHL